MAVKVGDVVANMRNSHRWSAADGPGSVFEDGFGNRWRIESHHVIRLLRSWVVLNQILAAARIVQCEHPYDNKDLIVIDEDIDDGTAMAVYSHDNAALGSVSLKLLRDDGS